MQSISYDLSQPSDTHQLQQMIQGLGFCSIVFNRQASPVFIAHQSRSIVGFVYGQKGYGDQSHILTIHGSYLRNHIDDDQHRNELLLALINHAEKNLGVTHYRMNEFDELRPIGISHLIPPQTTEDDRISLEADQFSECDFYTPRYAHS